jgi:hypothetical protein
VNEDGRDDRDLWKDWRQQIAEDLDGHRPDRYGRGETDWMGPVIARARGRMPTDDALVIRRHVEREVRNQETQASRRGNDLVRQWREGQRPLDWQVFGPCPIVVGGDKPSDEVHVRLDAASLQDVRDAIDAGHSRNLANYNRAELALDGYRVLERRAAAAGYEQLSLLGDLPPYGTEEGEEAA